MIFFSIPSVGQIKPETAFGQDDHFGFIQTLIGEEYNRAEVKEKCNIYYDKENPRYWDQIITLINFMGLKKLNDENKFTNIPVLNFIANKYDEDVKTPSKILFDYLLCQWQHPHPILTHNREIIDKSLGITYSKQRDFQLVKPYALILSILKYFYLLDTSFAYLTDDEFYWFGYTHYKNKGDGFRIENTEELALEILKIRKAGGWDKYENIKENDGTKTHLSYPKGFLKNSYVLTDKGLFYSSAQNFFIGLKPMDNLISKIDSLINSCNSTFEFDRTLSERNSFLGFRYSEYLYKKENIDNWLKSVNIYPNSSEIFKSIVDEDAKFDEVSFEKLKTTLLLQRIDVLDKETITRRRTEQHFLRKYLFKNKDSGACGVCNKDYPVKLLATAHIKKRSDCTDLEKRDFNVVMPACHLGCDKLYELGYLIVDSGVVKENSKGKIITSDLKDYINDISDNASYFYKPENKKYFDFHRKKHTSK